MCETRSSPRSHGRTTPRPECRAARGADDVVERVGVSGSSVTAVSRIERTAHACDATEQGVTCGAGFARLRVGRALDPRLSLTCRDAEGAAVAFAWIEPSPGAAYVVVMREGYAEAYRVVGRLPVRVTSTDVDPNASSARFELSEHARSGALIRRYVIQPGVAG